MANFLKYKHTDSSIKSIGEFIDQRNSLVEGISASDLLIFENNIDRIISSYTEAQTALNFNNTQILRNSRNVTELENAARRFPLNQGTILKIPKDKNKQETVFIYGKNQFLESRDFIGYWSNHLRRLLDDERYVKAESVTRDGRETDIQIINENVQIWVYSKVTESLIDISPFVMNCLITKEEVGTFSITLNPVVDINDVIQSGRDVVNYFQIGSMLGEHPIEMLNNLLQHNDIVFIRFEKLEIEGSTPERYEFEIDSNRLVNQVWDMIGLIDNCSSSYSANSTNYDTTITGRDLTKLLIEDCSYFMPLRYIQGNKTRFFYGGDPQDSWFRRNFISGGYDYLFFYGFRNIRNTLGFVINHLSNLGVIGDSNLFRAYGNRTSRIYRVEGANDYVVNKEVNGIWQIIKLQIDDLVEERVISDPSFAYVDGNLIDQFNKICQKPFVEFLPDTFGDIFSFTIRQPPFTQRAILSFIDGTYSFVDPLRENDVTIVKSRQETVIDIESKDLFDYNLSWTNEFYSWYQLQPQNVFLGEDAFITLSYVPIVYFNEYAEYFGNHRKIVADNYLPATTISGNTQMVNIGNLKRSLLTDLKYLIDTHAYLPFTRQGTITLTNGDRRIKRGTFIRLKATGEIYYVDAVSNSVSFTKDNVNRTTVLTVSRGMIEQYIRGSIGFESDGRIIERGGVPITFSYFNIINTQLIYDNLYKQTEDPIISTGDDNEQPVEVKQVRFDDGLNNALDRDIFDFFLKRKQLNIRRL